MWKFHFNPFFYFMTSDRDTIHSMIECIRELGMVYVLDVIEAEMHYPLLENVQKAMKNMAIYPEHFDAILDGLIPTETAEIQQAAEIAMHRI